MRKTQHEIPKQDWLDVDSRVVAVDRCSGCGVCPVVCPVDNCMTMVFDHNKEYKPQVDHDICVNCALCLQVCPDNDHLDQQVHEQFRFEHPECHHDPVLGGFTENYVGYSVQARAHGASGGILTALLGHMLRQRMIDGVVTAVSSTNPGEGPLFEASLVTTDEELRANAGSKYYPIEHSKTLEFIDENEGRYAVIGLPCTVLAIRKAQMRRPRLRKRIPFMFALTCGHNVSASYTDYHITSNGIALSTVLSVKYRDKVGTRTANDFNLAIEHTSGGQVSTSRLSFFGSNVGITWYNHLFTLNKCLYCTDLFGELADASFADAWLPEYMKDVGGTSLVVVRNRELDSTLKEMEIKGELVLSRIGSGQVVESQRSQVKFKRDGVAERVRLQRFFRKGFPEYGLDSESVSLLSAFRRQMPTLLNVHVSKWLYRHGYLNRLGTRWFLRITHAYSLPYRTLRWLWRRGLSTFTG